MSLALVPMQTESDDFAAACLAGGIVAVMLLLAVAPPWRSLVESLQSGPITTVELAKSY
jgi:hypothetical protein